MNGSDRLRQLETLLLEIFQHPRDLRKIWGDAFGEQVNSDINWEQSLRDVVFDTILWLQSRQLLAKFLQALGNARAGRRDDIERIAELFLVSAEPPPRQQRAALHVLLFRFERLMTTERALMLERTVEKHVKQLATSHGLALDVTVSDDEAPLELEKVRNLGERLGADIVIWGDLYDLRDAVEFELRWMTHKPATLPSAAKAEGTTGIATVHSLSMLTSGRLLGQVDFLVAWLAGMQRFNIEDYASAARFFDSALRFVASSVKWHYRMQMSHRGFELEINRPWVDALGFLALSHKRAGCPREAIRLLRLILTFTGESSQGSFQGDPFALMVFQGQLEQMRAYAALTLAYAEALRDAEEFAAALEAYRKMCCLLAPAEEHADMRPFLQSALLSYSTLAYSQINTALGNSFADEIRMLWLLDGMNVPIDMMQAVTHLDRAQCRSLLETLSTNGLIVPWTTEQPLLRFEQIFARTSRDTDLDREAKVLRRIGAWLAGQSPDRLANGGLSSAIRYLLDSGPAFLSIEDMQSFGPALGQALSPERSSWWLEAMRGDSLLALPMGAIVQQSGGFKSERAMCMEVVRGALGLAVEARRDACHIAQKLEERGVDSRFWSLAPEWLRNQMTLLATPGATNSSGGVPVAYLQIVGPAWFAVIQTTRGGEAGDETGRSGEGEPPSAP